MDLPPLLMEFYGINGFVIGFEVFIGPGKHISKFL